MRKGAGRNNPHVVLPHDSPERKCGVSPAALTKTLRTKQILLTGNSLYMRAASGAPPQNKEYLSVMSLFLPAATQQLPVSGILQELTDTLARTTCCVLQAPPRSR